MMETLHYERKKTPDERANSIDLLFVEGWPLFERREVTADLATQRTGQEKKLGSQPRSRKKCRPAGNVRLWSSLESSL